MQIIELIFEINNSGNFGVHILFLVQAQLISIAKTNMLFVLKEKDEKVQKLSSFYESALLDKEQTIQSLQLRIASLNSQINEYKKQLTVIQEESRMKDHLLEQTVSEMKLHVP